LGDNTAGVVIVSRKAAVVGTLLSLTSGALGMAVGLGHRLQRQEQALPGAGRGAAEKAPRPEVAVADDPGLVGVVIPVSSVKLTAKETGEVANIPARVGDAVKPGQVLVVLRSRTVDDDLHVGRAGIDKASAEQQQLERELGQARARLDRTVALGEFAAREELDESRAALEILQAKLARARAALREQRSVQQKRENDRRDLELRAPFAGTVGSRFVDQGAVVQPMQPILEVVSTGPHLVRFAVPADRKPQVPPGTAVSVSALGDRVDAVVNALSPSSDPVSGLFYAELTLSESASERWSPGMAVRVRVPQPRSVPELHSQGPGRDR
jgi:membrane fusion protein, multidrug efflux system